MNACLSGRPLLGELLGKWIWYMLHGSKLCCLRLLKELCIYFFIDFICHTHVSRWCVVHLSFYSQRFLQHHIFISWLSNLWQSVRRLLTSRNKTFGRCWLCYHPFRFLRSMILCSWDVSCFSLLFLVRKNTIGKPSPRGSYPWQFLLWELRS